MKLSKLTVVLASLLLSHATLSADTYKWTDDTGQVQYTQIPPKDRPYETIKTKVKNPESPVAKPANASKSEESPKGDVAIAKAEAEKLAVNCDRAKQNKEMLTTAAKIRVTDKDGNPRHLTDEERKEKLQATELQIQSYCKQ